MEQECRPGNGWGDRNHCHTGSHGESTTIEEDHCRPGWSWGWGWGDRNHCHSGPPGNSHGNSHGDDESAHFRLIGFAASSGTRSVFVVVGALLILMAVALQRRMRRLW